MTAPPAPDTPGRSAGPAPLAVPDPPAVSSAQVVLVGTVLWLVALVLTLAVPALHEGDRDFWPWACVVGLVLGGLGYSYVRRGRGNAAGVEQVAGSDRRDPPRR